MVRGQDSILRVVTGIMADTPMPSVRSFGLPLLSLLALSCSANDPGGPPADGLLAIGTWGGTEAGALVTDTLAHVHIGCTYGDIQGRVTLDADGRFTRAGTYLLRAYPVALGPNMPAQFTGQVRGRTLTITVTVSDTVENTTVVRGPVTVQLGTEPTMANCPICRTPGDRASARAPAAVPAWRRWLAARFRG